MTKDFINQKILHYAEKHNLDVEHTLDDFYIIGSSSKLSNFLDKHDFNYGFSDEYCSCSDCYNSIRTSPDSYGWIPDFYIGDGFILCNECFHASDACKQEYLASIINNPKKCNQLLSEDDILQNNFIKLNKHEFENGLHQGMNDDPKEIYNRFKNVYKEIIFSQSEQSQFYVTFDVYGRNNSDIEIYDY